MEPYGYSSHRVLQQQQQSRNNNEPSASSSFNADHRGRRVATGNEVYADLIQGQAPGPGQHHHHHHRQASAPTEAEVRNVQSVRNVQQYHNSIDADEAYARRLQEELEREERRRQRAEAAANEYENRRQYEITPVDNDDDDAVPYDCATSDRTSNRGRNRNENRSNRNRNHNNKEKRENLGFSNSRERMDEIDDRRIAQELQDEELARQISSRESRRTSSSRSSTIANGSKINRKPSNGTASTAPLSDDFAAERSPSFERTASTYSGNSDSSAARKIAQELDDAEMAQRLAAYEQEAIARQNEEEATSRNRKLIMYRLLPLFCLGVGVAVALLFIFDVLNPDNIRESAQNFGDRIRGEDIIDPFRGDVITDGEDGTPITVESDQMRWSTNGRGGIELEIINAMEERWVSIFDVAVSNWDMGSPVDSLKLETTRAEYDAVCEAVPGRMKACNANYGRTQWKGLNELLLNRRTQEILASSAKMNDFYLDRDSDDEKLYTVCHELGHGFGLPHWDEDFTNADLGNCMDYTNRPGRNRTPDASNFVFLSQIYGGIDVSTGDSITAEDALAAATAEEENNGGGDGDDQNGESRRLLRQQKRDRHLNEMQSRVHLGEDMRLRRVLSSNDHFEVHQVWPDEDNENAADDVVMLHFYLMA